MRQYEMADILYRFADDLQIGGRNNQQYTLICTTYLFYIMTATCFVSSLPSSVGFLDPSELLGIQIEWVVYHILCGYVACVLESICCASHSICISSNSKGSKKFPDDGRLLPKHVGASI
jgi:hypothetical protein